MKKIILNVIIILITLIMISSNICFAAQDEIDTNLYKEGENNIYGGGSISKVDSIVGIILGAIQVVGSFVAIIMLIYIGIMYMKESPAGKAQTKERLYPYFIGAILLFGGSNLLQIVAEWINVK